MNPNHSEAIVRFHTYENQNFTSTNYEEFYQDVIKRIQGSHIEIAAIICDKCPAQVNGVGRSLAFFPRLGIHCLNHIVQLVFTHAVSSASVAPIIAMVDGAITDLQTPEGIGIMGRRCPMLVKNRWVCLVYVLRYILSYHGVENEGRGVLEHDPIQKSFAR
jgi:hypothetical protein